MMPPAVGMIPLVLLIFLHMNSYSCFPNFVSDDAEPLIDQLIDPLLDYDRLDEAFDRSRNDTPRCGPCDRELCPGARGCRAGELLDACGCCPECGNLEGQACDPGGQSVYYGRCGSGLSCRLDRGGPGPGGEQHGDEEGDEPLCVCAEQEPLCASDGVTYLNLCQFREANFSNPHLELKERGPCKTVPVIKVAPHDQMKAVGGSLLFLCEVFAFPMAQVDWTQEGRPDPLPGDDPRVSVQSRGGPQRFELSSWLQIEGAEAGDSGTYRCVARNVLGTASASATLGVLSPEELSAYLTASVSEMKEMLEYSQPRGDQDYY